MARPKTKGEPIQLRLSAETDATLRARAEEVGKPVGVYLADYLERAARSLEETRAVGARTARPSTVEPNLKGNP